MTSLTVFLLYFEILKFKSLKKYIILIITTVITLEE